MGDSTIDELLELADHPEDLSQGALLRLQLALTKENYIHIRELNGSVAATAKRVDELERHPSLLHLIITKPRQSILMLLGAFLGTHYIVDLGLYELVKSYINNIW